MNKILIRAAQDPLKEYGALTSTKKMGGNSGNLLYANGVARALASSGNQVSYGGFDAHVMADPSEWIEHTNANYDHFVMPMANIFRAGFTNKLFKFADLIRKLEIPVTVVGIGAQTTVDALDSSEFKMSRTGREDNADDQHAERHNRAVREFCLAVLEKSQEIGVRGEYTKAYLESVGVPADRVRVIGCPSLYTWGPDLRIDVPKRPINKFSDLSMNIDYRVRNIDRMIDANFALYPWLTTPSQDSKSARMVLRDETLYDLSTLNERTPIHTDHYLYRDHKVIYYPNPWGWIDALGRKDFVFGTRLHGNIAGILGGTPGHLVAHDSRTTELARYHGIPSTQYDPDGDPLIAADLYKNTDYTEFNDLMPVRFANYLEFLHQNNLTTIYDTDGGKAPEFDAALPALRKIGAKYPLNQRPQQSFLDRGMRKIVRSFS